MRSYEDISKRIMERGDKLIEERKVRAARIKHTSYAVSGMCAAAIAGIGVWHIASNMKKPDEDFKSPGIVTATEASSESTTDSALITTAAAITTEKAAEDRISTTTAAAAVTSETKAAISTSPIQTASVKTTTLSATDSESPVMETSVIPSVPEPPETTATTYSPLPVTTTGIGEEGNTANSGESAQISHTDPYSGITTTIISETAHDITTTVQESPSMGNGGYMPVTTTSLQDSFRANPSYFNMDGAYYEKQAMVAEESVGEYFRRVDLHIVYMHKNIKAVMKSYMIKDVDTEEAVAVRLNDTDEYYLFRNPSYKKDAPS
ncbi:hypothetical protein [Ruminococcus sp.]|uniref:hypothetical protein n=1 Tax=Ruminococcus sp. TaxID=41978 RepID=UPI0025CFC3AA|nr:hypothetical protein [Ruminococcus sp.]MCR4638789.1 hypothetical protein [Ruminococcus sp.]